MLSAELFRAQRIALACLTLAAAHAAVTKPDTEPFTAPAALVTQWRPVPIYRPA